METEMATQSSILARKFPWTEGPGGLQSMGSRKRHNLETKQQQQGNKEITLLRWLDALV